MDVLSRDIMIESERDLFERELQEFYYVQNELDDVQARLADEAADDDVRDFFAGHHEATTDQLERLEGAFEAINAEPTQRESSSLEGLLETREALTEDTQRADLDDLIDVETALAIERLEITRLETLLLLADRLKLEDEVIEPLERSKAEAENAVGTLQELAAGY